MVRSSNSPDFLGTIQNLSKNVSQSTRLTAILARVTFWDQPTYAPRNVSPTLETSSRVNTLYPSTPSNILLTSETVSTLNAPYLISPIVVSVKSASRDQLSTIPSNDPPTLETSSFSNTSYPITPAVTLVKAITQD